MGDRGEEKVFVRETTATGKVGRMRSRMGGGGDRGNGVDDGRFVEGKQGDDTTMIRRWRRRPVAATTAAAGRLHAGITRSRQGEAVVLAAGTAAARDGAAAVVAAEAAVGLLP